MPLYLGPSLNNSNTPVVQSGALREFHAHCSASGSKNRRFELKDVYSNVVEFAGDQAGSRFLQQKLEQANSDEKGIIFDEIMPNARQLMFDVFGNYVLQKLFEHGDQIQKKQLANEMKNHIYPLSLQMYGCRVVQKAFDHILTDQQAELVSELNEVVPDKSDHRVLRCIRDQNGNHVIQKAIEVIDSRYIGFIYEVVTGKIIELSLHAYGCRVIQRMLEKNDPNVKRQVLDELSTCDAELIKDQFGNYVAQHVITHGDITSRNRIIKLILDRGVKDFAKHKFASNVVEKCVVHGTTAQQIEILRQIMEPGHNQTQGESLYEYVKCGFGNYVIRKFT
ncbi:ARM repeat-containing protein [Microthyrium microscopicum]|uniref:ARM repeat-containing protein n=1 Tax=Microthyrium microscopicum TaxID=703497 RepID=A0A6A6ULE7_9PEZI|nr:ARM repeat-containing protein [Microthyrium microscopicum]